MQFDKSSKHVKQHIKRWKHYTKRENPVDWDKLVEQHVHNVKKMMLLHFSNNVQKQRGRHVIEDITSHCSRINRDNPLWISELAPWMKNSWVQDTLKILPFLRETDDRKPDGKMSVLGNNLNSYQNSQKYRNKFHKYDIYPNLSVSKRYQD